MKINGLILAAGFSGRMNFFKPIIQVNGKTLIHLIAEKLSNVCDEVSIVTGYNKEIIENEVKEIKKVRCIYNDKFEMGMFTSLKKGLESVKDSDWIIYHFVDQPTLPVKFYEDFIQQIQSNYNWIQPSYKNKNGHPILLSNQLFDVIICEDDNCSLKEVSKTNKVKRMIWNCDYPEILEDIDTQEDYEKIVMKERQRYE